ncbi:MAG: hypothetical protein GY861_07140 [bacterium]|nr:hypothetical protein [bacterium]
MIPIVRSQSGDIEIFFMGTKISETNEIECRGFVKENIKQSTNHVLTYSVRNPDSDLGNYVAKIAEQNTPNAKKLSVQKGVKQGLIIPLPYKTIEVVVDNEKRAVDVSASITELNPGVVCYSIENVIAGTDIEADLINSKFVSTLDEACMQPFAEYLDDMLREMKHEKVRPIVEKYGKP